MVQLGNNRRRRDIEAVRAIFKRRGCAVELQSHSVADRPCNRMCCPLCGKTGIRLVAFTDVAGVLHMIGVGPMPWDSSCRLSWYAQSATRLMHAFRQNPLWIRSSSRCCLRAFCEARLGPSGCYRRRIHSTHGPFAKSSIALKAAATAMHAPINPF